ncbi:MAG: acyl carrier protein [Saprospiraceae bacterium]|nr:acyl carrier protein [Saprospiraceae bacterium]
MERLFKILEEVRPDIDFKIEKKLIDDGILDSFDIVSIISELNDEFDIAIRVTELNAENMNSAESMLVMIKRLQSKV